MQIIQRVYFTGQAPISQKEPFSPFQTLHMFGWQLLHSSHIFAFMFLALAHTHRGPWLSQYRNLSRLQLSKRYTPLELFQPIHIVVEEATHFLAKVV